MSNNLVIDWGNTRVKVATYSNRLRDQQIVVPLLTEKILEKEFPQWRKMRVILCSVSSASDSLEKVLKERAAFFLRLTHDTPIPLPVIYKTPQTLGYDRLANAVAVFHIAPKEHHALAIDVGTCLKFDFVHRDKGYMGGGISPGLLMRYRALHRDTHALPKLDPVDKAALIGNSTDQSIHSGVINGMFAEIEGIIQRYEQEFSPISIYITGGDAQSFEMATKNNIFAHSFLTLAGLNEILDFNQHA